MGYHSFDLQSAIFSLLSGDSNLDSLVGNNKIFDSIAPQDTAYPYVIIGLETIRDVGTKTLDGNIYNVDIDVWSQYRGQKEIKEIMERIYNLLNNATISVSGASSIMSYVVNTVTLTEVDGITRHGIVNIDFTIFDS
jgi:hypothetical protein|tara:strand:+ start:17517 stop:17927 length:411 start_codon:yes stop_codon:yes gene_type:complete